MIYWKTDLIVAPSPHPIGLQDPLFTIGSCFAEAIGNRFIDHKFKIQSNPFGTLYNPYSIHHLLQLAIEKKMPDEVDYLEQYQIHSHYQFHSRFSSLDRLTLELKIKQAMEEAFQFLKTAKRLIITYGSAFIYQRNDTKNWVANCHKMPSSNFTKKLLSAQEIEKSFSQIYQRIQSFNPSLQIILTVSPVRHLKDTLELNSVSKSTLRLSCHQIATHFAVDYFPAYEIMMDDLRDYRFYQSDRIHPTEEAEDYIWAKFGEKYFDMTTKSFLENWQTINYALNHRPAFPTTEQHQLFLQSTLTKLEAIRQQVDVESEIVNIKGQLHI
jgi:hypothetical protein